MPVLVPQVSTEPGFLGLGCSRNGRGKSKLSLYDITSYISTVCYNKSSPGTS